VELLAFFSHAVEKCLFALFLFLVYMVLCLGSDVMAFGPYAPAAGQSGSTAVDKDSPYFVAWASGSENWDYQVGDEVNATWQTPHKAEGPPGGSVFDIVSLGRGGAHNPGL
jgi:hypothetical protein